MRLPPHRGPLSAAVLALLTGAASGAEAAGLVATALTRVTDAVCDADLQLALGLCYELHYQGLDGVPDDLEWSPDVLAVRRLLEQRFEEDLRTTSPPPWPEPAETIGAALRRLVDADAGPSLSTYMLRHATLDQFRDFVIQRSIYQLKEADPHTWAVPRLPGRAKAALVEIQFDEYGGGRPGRMHAEMFAQTMRALGLDDSYGAYLPEACAEAMAVTNLMSFFGLHRRHRAALVGQLAALEMDSTTPNRRYANGLRRLGIGPAATAYFDEHVEADAVHEQLAAVDLCGSFVADDPDPAAAREVLWGAACGLALQARLAQALLAGWGAVSDEQCA
jgi:Arc/MetJ family transcription regulator